MKKNYYPLGIAIFFGLMCCMIILTIYVSLKYSPDYDNAYFSTRQVVDKDINAILEAQNALESRYKFYIIDGKNAILLQRKANRKSNALFVPIEATLRFKITDLKGKAVMGESMRIYITRFADSSADKDIGELAQNYGIFTSPKIHFEKGEWKLLVEFGIDGKKAYFEQRIVLDDKPKGENSAGQKPKDSQDSRDFAINHNLA